jgi:hypothetical protein
MRKLYKWTSGVAVVHGNPCSLYQIQGNCFSGWVCQFTVMPTIRPLCFASSTKLPNIRAGGIWLKC